MPIKKSSKKALRKSLRRRARNLRYKNTIKSLVKEMRLLIAQKKIQEATNLLPKVAKALDKAAKVGVIKKNTASRKKSRLAKFLRRTASA